MGKASSKSSSPKRPSSTQADDRMVRSRINTTVAEDSTRPGKIKVHTLGGNVLSFDLDPTSTVRQLKEEIQHTCDVHTSTQRLLHANQEVDDKSRLCDIGLKQDSSLHLVVSSSPVLHAHVPMDDAAVSEALLAESCYIGGLDLGYCKHLTDTTASLIAENPQYHDGVTLLNLEYNTAMTSDGLQKLFVNMHCLETVKLRAVRGLNDASLRCLCCVSGAKLRKLDVSCCSISKDGLLAVAEHCPQLREICLDGVVVEESAILGVTRSCTQLMTIHLRQVDLSPETISELSGHAPQVEHLSIYVNASRGDSGKILAALEALIKCHPVLVQLELILSCTIAAEDSLLRGLTSALGKCTQLQQLAVTGLPDTSMKWLRRLPGLRRFTWGSRGHAFCANVLAAHCPALEVLHLDTSLPQAEVARVLSLFADATIQVVELELPCVTDCENAFRKLLVASPSLRILRFRGVESPEALIGFMQAVAEVCTELETFEISCMNGCRGGFALCCKAAPGASDANTTSSNLDQERRLLREITVKSGASLQKLVISKGCNVTSAEILAIARSCPALRKLDLSHSGRDIQEDDIVQLTTACSHLESLSLAFKDSLNLQVLRECTKCQRFWIPPGRAACSACGARTVPAP